MGVPDFTIVVAVDSRTLGQFCQVWPVWRKTAPCLLDRPLALLVDGRMPPENRTAICAIDHPRLQQFSWDRLPEYQQRERMLTAFVKMAPHVVETPYWLKIDTDAFPLRSGFQVLPEWFDGEPVLVSNPWGYTKPGEWINDLETWAETVPNLAAHPPLDLHSPPGALRFGHPRIASWMCFVRTDWSREVAGYCGDRLPVPSQDTYHWYCAARRGDLICKVSFKRHGWVNVSSNRIRTITVRDML